MTSTKIQTLRLFILSTFILFESINCEVKLDDTYAAYKKPDAADLYEEAYALSSKIDASSAVLRHAGSLYLKASGFGYEDLRHPSSIASNVTIHRGVLRELAKCLEHGFGVPKNEKLSFEFFRRAARLGDPEAQFEMAVRHSYGMTDDKSYSTGKFKFFSEADEKMALLHYTFAAYANDTFSQMALGYRHTIGLGTPKNCPTAATYYNTVAEKVIEISKSQGSLPFIEKVRLSTRSHHGFKRVREEQWFQYYQYSADMGDVDAQTAVGRLYNFGAQGIERNHARALHYFKQAAEAGDGNAMAHLGHMYANGVGIKKDNKTALYWFKKAAEKKSANGYYGLGYLLLTGYGVEKNHDMAYQYFSKAAENGHVDAQFHLGVMHLKGYGTRTSPMKALAFFTAASHGGHLLAMYNLAMMHLSGMGVEPNCLSALKLLKQIAEKGPWSSILQRGHELFREGDYYHSLLDYLRSAQIGLEYGQSNAAWMLEHGYAPGYSSENILIALGLYERSAEQENTLSLLSIGDIFYYGRGIDKDWVQASGIYQQAEKYRSSRAAYNLGFMYEFGAGVPKDLHLARRYYDLAKEYNADAYIASQFALDFLAFHSWCERKIPFLSKGLLKPLFSLKYLHSPKVPPGWWSGRRSEIPSKEGMVKEPNVVEKMMELLDLDVIGDAFQDLIDAFREGDAADAFETAILGALLILFLLVFRRRQRIRRTTQRDEGIENNLQDGPIEQAPAENHDEINNVAAAQENGPLQPILDDGNEHDNIRVA